MNAILKTAVVCSCGFSALWASLAVGQTGPIDDATFAIDPTTGLQNLTTLTVTRNGVTEVFTPADLINIDVTDVSTAFPPQGGPALFGVPAVDPPGTPGDEITATAPAPGTRNTLLEDFAINTALNNPGNDEGIVFNFASGGITNGDGADLVLFELSPPPGVAPIGGQVTPGLAVGGDPFTIAGTGADAGLSASFGPEAFGPLSNVTVDDITFFGSGTLAAAASNVSGLAEFESIGVGPLVVTGPTSFLLQASAIDLSDLGFALGVTVSELELLSNPLVVVNASGGESGPFGVDPALIVGLPTVAAIPEPGSAGILGLLASSLLLGRRRARSSRGRCVGLSSANLGS